ncbi:MAG: hypothetical protein HQL66_04040 [Magnetococcales bacterium]|nr:hypothetical protein [Magnetococcales bacterium]
MEATESACGCAHHRHDQEGTVSRHRCHNKRHCPTPAAAETAAHKCCPGDNNALDHETGSPDDNTSPPTGATPEPLGPKAVTSRLEQLKTNLHLTATQEKEWQAYADVVTRLFSQQPLATKPEVRDTPENRLENLEQLLAQEETILPLRRAILQKYRSLHATLSHEQRETLLREGIL